MAKNKDEAARDDFLDRCKVEGDLELYAIGLSERGITLYKQQVRALNLIYALHATHKLDESIAVIGGGAAGATAALAAATLGYSVSIFEQRPTLLHLQQGCDIRWLHPHIYDWPASGSDSPYAGLPMLDWEFATAAEVAARLQAWWEAEVMPNENDEGDESDEEEIADKENGDEEEDDGEGSGLDITLHTRASAYFAGATAGGLKVRWDNSDANPRAGEQTFDTVIIAVGFGVESGVLEKSAQSYWRNDSVNQPLPGIPSQRSANYFISGPGDGGLIDLLRLCINDFNQGRILDELFFPDDSVIEKLREIIAEWGAFSSEQREEQEKSAWLFNKYEDLQGVGLLDDLEKRLDGRTRDDTVVILNGKAETFALSLSLSGASLFNTLLAYMLYRLECFSYVPGKCERINDTTARVAFKQFKYDYPVDRLIFRHGPKRWETLEAVGLSELQISGLKAKEKDIRFYKPERLWPAGWWKENQDPPPPKAESHTEFVSPVTCAIATTFVKTLGEMLIQQDEQKRGKKSKFRVTLHRIIKIKEEVFFQQISRYAGTQTKGAVGRVITINAGLVGRVCHFGAPLIVTREKDFDKLLKDVKLEEAGARKVRTPVQSMLACPFFAPKIKPDDAPSVLAVLFMDSEEKDFFAEPPVLRLIYSACKGFVRDLDEKKKMREVGFVTTDWRGNPVTAKTGELDAFEKEYESVADDGGIFKHFEHDLTFEEVTSLEMHLRGARV